MTPNRSTPEGGEVRFEEMELTPGPSLPGISTAPATTTPTRIASRWRRLLATATDLSLFLALALAMTPLIQQRGSIAATFRGEALAIAGVVGFLLVLSYYYFVGGWLVWGKTVGGAIFDLEIERDEGTKLDIRAANWRWTGLMLSLLTGGIGFAVGILPGGRTLADRLSHSCPVRAF
ncbi:MAG: RDD family protein [Thermoanaerobaculia bacterium]